MRALALPLEGFPSAFGTDENRAGTGHQGICKYVSLKVDRCDSSRVWLGCAACATDYGFVNTGSDVSQGNASVCRPSGSGRRRVPGSQVVAVSTHFVGVERCPAGTRACACARMNVTRLTVLGHGDEG